MTNDLVAMAETGFLALAPNSPEANLIRSVHTERELNEAQFAVVLRIADAPPPALAMATDDDVRKVIGALAGILKSPRTSLEQGRLQLGLYRKALTGQITAGALNYAGDQALASLEWMPTPSELLKLAKPHTAPETLTHSRAVRLAADRRQRLFEERCKAIRKRTLPEEELASLSDQELRHGIEHRAILKRLDGSVAYWSKEAWETDLKERASMLSAMVSGSSRAREGEGGSNGKA